ncbi:hypothetical protein ACFL0Y_02005 [Patescibacteria group bacterium]
MSEQGHEEVIRIELPEQEADPFAENIKEAQKMALAKLPHASSLVEHLQLTNAARNLKPNNLEWTRAECGDLTADDWLADFMEERDRERFEEEAGIIETMLNLAEKNTDKAEIVILKTGDEDFPEHRALLIMPEGQKVESYDVPRTSDDEQDILYMNLTAACSHQAAQLILKNNDRERFSIDPHSLGKLREMMGFDISGGQQNFRERDSDGQTIGHKNEKLYLLFALQGGFSNEDSRYLISDYGDFGKT